MSSFVLGLLSVIFPPLPVWIKRGICSADSFINIALCCLGYLPGLIHAIYIILKYPETSCAHHQGYQPLDLEHGQQGGGSGGPGNNARVYVYTASYPSAAAHTQRKIGTPGPQGRSGPQHYGTVNNSTSSPAAGAGAGAQESVAANGPQFLPSVTPHEGGEGSSSKAPEQQPPSYNDAVKGDFKVQTQD